MTHSDIAVIVPCRNAAEYLAELLDSLAAQTLQPTEVVVVDDGSIDGSAAVGQDWAAAHPEFPLRVLSLPPRGVAAAMVRGIDSTQAPLLARADADDRVSPRWLELLAAALEASPATAFAYPAMCMFGHAEGRYHTMAFSAPALVFEGNFICCGALMRRQAYARTRGFAELPAWEDWDLWLSFLEMGEVGVLVDEELYQWRRHRTSRNTMSWSRRRLLRLRIWWRHRRLLVRYLPHAPIRITRRLRHRVRAQ